MSRNLIDGEDYLSSEEVSRLLKGVTSPDAFDATMTFSMTELGMLKEAIESTPRPMKEWYILYSKICKELEK